MVSFTENLNFITSLGAVLGQVLFLCVLGLIVFSRTGNPEARVWARQNLAWAGRYGLDFAFFVALTSTIISLVYSEIIGFVPCGLCWIQRVFLYPQVVILGLALWLKARDAFLYCGALSILGASIAVYHFYGQSFNPSVLPACDASGQVSCAVRYFVEFGYVTMPLMSLTSFVLILTGLYLANRLENK